MAGPVALRSDYDARALRRLAKASRDADQTRRLLALAAIYDGSSRRDGAEIGGVGLQTVRDWVLRFNFGSMRRVRPDWGTARPRAGAAPSVLLAEMGSPRVGTTPGSIVRRSHWDGSFAGERRAPRNAVGPSVRRPRSAVLRGMDERSHFVHLT